MFLAGRSFGGLIVTNMSETEIGKKMFRATILITPYYRLANEKLYNLQWQINLLSYLQPHKLIERPEMDRDRDYMIKWGRYIDDPK